MHLACMLLTLVSAERIVLQNLIFKVNGNWCIFRKRARHLLPLLHTLQAIFTLHDKNPASNFLCINLISHLNHTGNFFGVKYFYKFAGSDSLEQSFVVSNFITLTIEYLK